MILSYPFIYVVFLIKVQFIYGYKRYNTEKKKRSLCNYNFLLVEMRCDWNVDGACYINLWWQASDIEMFLSTLRRINLGKRLPLTFPRDDIPFTEEHRTCLPECVLRFLVQTHTRTENHGKREESSFEKVFESVVFLICTQDLAFFLLFFASLFFFFIFSFSFSAEEERTRVE